MQSSRVCVLFVLLSCTMLSAQAWIPGPSVPTNGNLPRAGAVAVRASAGFLLLGGTPLTSGDARVDRLAGTAWIPQTPLEGSHAHLGAAQDSRSRVIVFGGLGGGDSYEWTNADGNAGGIASRSSQAPEQGFALATDSNALVYSLGGSSGTTFAVAAANGRVERYDGDTDAWTVLAPMPTPVADAAACGDGQGHILVFGGFTTVGSRTGNVARYDIQTNTWSDTAIADLPAARTGAGAALGNDDRVYVVGGADGTGPKNTVFVLDPTTGTWSIGPSLNVARAHFGCAVDDTGLVWAVGGDTTNTSENLFTPTCPLVSGPTDGVVFVGTGAGFEVDVAGTAPFTYQWRADGVPLVDGSTGNGSTIVGATTSRLGILGAKALDALHGYDCVVGNACGQVPSAPAHFSLVPPALLPTAFLGESLHPVGALSSTASSVDNGVVVGSASFTHPTYGQLSHPMRWQDLGTGATTATAADLTPASSVGGGTAKVRNGTIAGWWWAPYWTPFGTGYYQNACIWPANGPGHTNVQPQGFEIGRLTDTDGAYHTGTCLYDETSANSDGFFWPLSTTYSAVRTTPVGAWGSACSSIDGAHHYGWVHIGYGVLHGARWSGTSSEFHDMNPTGASRSYVDAASDGQQVGTAQFGGTVRTGTWSGSAGSWQPLEMPGTTITVTACRRGLLLGSRSVDGHAAASVWRSSADDWLDLHQFVPPGFSTSTAADLSIDQVTGAMTIVGSGFNTLTGRTEAMVWRSASVAATAQRLGQPCPITIEFTPDGIGGYQVTRTSAIWYDDTTTGSEIAAGGLLPENTMSAPQPLTFAFMMPGGSTTTSIYVDDNGRIVSSPAAASSNTPVPAVMRLGPAVIAPFWTDLSSAQGSVRFHSDPAGAFATVTWRNVPQAGESNAFTFQLRLRPNGSFAMTYVVTNGWLTRTNDIEDNVLVGCSGGGNVPDPGPSNYAVYPLSSNGASTVYQWWQAAASPQHPELQSHLHVTGLAASGGSLDVELGGGTSATLGQFLLIGFVDPALDVTALLTGQAGLSGCALHSQIDIPWQLTMGAGTAVGSLPMPLDPTVVGLRFYAQGLSLAPGESLFLGLVLGDAFAITVGG